MANIKFANSVQTPEGVLGTGGGGGGTSLMVPISALTKPEWGIHPMTGVTDAGITDGHPTPTTGLRYISWQDLKARGWINLQGNNPQTAGPNIVTAAGESVMMNQCNPRWHLGTTNYWFNGIQNIRFETDSLVVIPEWYQSTAHVSSANHDMHMMVEDGGEMKHLSSSGTLDGLPRTSTFGSGFHSRRITHTVRRSKRYRVIIPSSGYFRGLWIDEKATIRATPNYPLVFGINGDSWSDDSAAGQTWSSSAGFSWPTGSYQTLLASTMLSFHLGVPVFSTAQGGTGEEEDNGTSGGADSSYSGNRSSAMWTDSRVNHQIDNFGPQYFIEVSIGSWNDGPGGAMVAPYDDTYRDRIAARYDKMIARTVAEGRADTDIKMITVSVQPVANSTEGSTIIGQKDLQAQGQAEIPALFPDNCLGHIPIRFVNELWVDRGDSGSRTPYVLADDLHLNVSGHESIQGFIAQHIRNMVVPMDYVIKTQQGVVA